MNEYSFCCKTTLVEDDSTPEPTNFQWTMHLWHTWSPKTNCRELGLSPGLVSWYSGPGQSVPASSQDCLTSLYAALGSLASGKTPSFTPYHFRLVVNKTTYSLSCSRLVIFWSKSTRATVVEPVGLNACWSRIKLAIGGSSICSCWPQVSPESEIKSGLHRSGGSR